MNAKILSELGLEAPTRSDFQEHDSDILREKTYNNDELERFVDNNNFFNIMPSLISRIPSVVIESQAMPGISASLFIESQVMPDISAGVL
jgi:hypothetical protein